MRFSFWFTISLSDKSRDGGVKMPVILGEANPFFY